MKLEEHYKLKRASNCVYKFRVKASIVGHNTFSILVMPYHLKNIWGH